MSAGRTFDHLVVGGGLAAVSALDGIREVDPGATVLLLSEEAEPPYQRPPLSKEYLRFPEAPRELLHVKPEGWFAGLDGVTLLLRQRVLVLDPAARRVTTARGDEFEGGRILLATGGRARRAGVPGERLDGVHTLRDVEDAEALRERAVEGARAVLVGAGFIGMELAASLTELGVDCTVVEAGGRVWPRALPEQVAAPIRDEYERRGVTFRFGARLERFEGTDAVRAVTAGGERIPCDFAVVGIGMEPRDGLAADAGLAVQDGVRVDRFGETSHAGIFAAGDVARHPHPLDGRPVRTEHWEHARLHGRLVGRNMAGAHEPYAHLSHLFSEAFDWKLSAVGDTAGAERVLWRGTPGAGPSIAFCERAGRLGGAILLDAPDALEPCRALVRAGPETGPLERALADPGVPLAEIAGGIDPRDWNERNGSG
ncbi:MAG: FAD-dependent oxidoreductase [Gemmatimonadota bacterium]|nr:FAD-dependent oxidoreductase [Gemmatimonadota bacterium]